MAEPLKNQFFQPSFVNDLAVRIAKIYKPFDQEEFKKLIYNKHWQDKTLKEMMSHISYSLQRTLPPDYPEALKILEVVGVHYKGFDGMIFPDFVGQFGLDYWEESLHALELFTQYSSGEFAIRHFIIKDVQLAMKKMFDWSRHVNHHVRRLSSEGCRPRLPWAMALPFFKEDPEMILPILENLKGDESEYVRKSVANNLNDITKDNVEIALDVAEEWMLTAQKETQWIVRHGLRGLIKLGNPRALALLGFKSSQIELTALKVIPVKLKLGDDLEISFILTNKGEFEANIVVDYVLHFVKSNGKTAPKVFKMTNIKMSPEESRVFVKKHTIKPITTRKYYAGTCEVEIQVNGLKLGRISFELKL